MQPKVTIIIPVYNVEKYLRQCLDSVVNQTMRDIQIICVNDGSPDGSRAILQEYADRDSRIEIIDKPNGGQASARNAAYPHIKGKYTLFVDSDDWIDLDTCEKTFTKAEETGAEVVLFFWKRELTLKKWKYKFWQISPQDKTTVQEKISLLVDGYVWDKLWRSDFLVANRLFFPEGLFFEDNMVCWQGVTMAKWISIVPEQLYHYRDTPNSVVNTPDKYGFDTIPIFGMIENFLRESGYYHDYREAFIRYKLLLWCGVCGSMTSPNRAKMISMIRESLTNDDRAFYHDKTGQMKKRVLRFYRGIVEGNRLETVKYYFFELPRLPERFWKVAVINPWRAILAYCTNTLHSSEPTANTIPFPAQESGESSERHVA